MTSRLLPRALRCALAAIFLVGAAPSVGFADTCPTSTLILGGVSEEIAGPTASGVRYPPLPPNASFYFRDYGDTVRFLCYFGFGLGDLTVRGRYRLLGAPPGTALSNQVQMRVQAYLHGLAGEYCTDTWAEVYLMQDQSVMAQGVWYNHYGEAECSGGGATTFSFTCSHPAGTEFEIAERIHCHLGDGYESGEATGKLVFGPLPPGAFMVRCDGDTTVHVVGVGPGVASALRIDAIRPNPSPGRFQAALWLPAGGPTIVRLLDVSGRAVETRVVDSPTGARRELSFGGSLPAGCYFLHASRGAVSDVRQVVIRR
jgi:hypothetical protein